MVNAGESYRVSGNSGRWCIQGAWETTGEFGKVVQESGYLRTKRGTTLSEFLMKQLRKDAYFISLKVLFFSLSCTTFAFPPPPPPHIAV